jgi:hypothetical protein
VFAHGLLAAEPGVLRRRRFGNLVLAGSQAALPADELRRRAAADPFPARVLDGEELDRFVAGTRPVTDATAQPSPMPPPAVLAGSDGS